MKQFICKNGHSQGIAEGDNYCFRCGTPVHEAVPECGCGRHLSVSDSYCPNCGKRVAEMEPKKVEAGK